MGYPKADLPFGGQSLLARVIDRLRAAGLSPIVAVAAANQQLPDDISGDIRVVRDRQPERGPLEGLAVGLQAAATDRSTAFVTSCDAPQLAPPLVRHLLEQLGEYEIVVPCEERFVHPLAAVYRCRLVDRIEQLLKADQLRPLFLIEQSESRRIDVEQLRPFDPELHSFHNMNRPEDYLAALAAAGLEPPNEIRDAIKQPVDRPQD